MRFFLVLSFERYRFDNENFEIILKYNILIIKGNRVNEQLRWGRFKFALVKTIEAPKLRPAQPDPKVGLRPATRAPVAKL